MWNQRLHSQTEQKQATHKAAGLAGGTIGMKLPAYFEKPASNTYQAMHDQMGLSHPPLASISSQKNILRAYPQDTVRSTYAQTQDLLQKNNRLPVTGAHLLAGPGSQFGQYKQHALQLRPSADRVAIN